MNEQRFEKHILELQEEYSLNRHNEYYREVIAKFSPWEKLCWKFHTKNVERKLRDYPKINVV